MISKDQQARLEAGTEEQHWHRIGREEILRSAIRAALAAGGVRPKSLEIGMAYVRSNMPVEMTEDDDGFRVEVVTPNGRVALRTAVADWLASDEAKVLFSEGTYSA
jgi:hypothetical protein